MPRWIDRLFVGVFLAMLAAPLAANLAGRDGADKGENRTLTAFPRVDGSWSSIRNFPPGVDGWFQDHFGFRAMLVRWYGTSRYFWLGISPSPLVIRGKDDWLFYEEDSALEDFVNDPLMTPAEIENWRQTVVRARDWCRARGMAYVLAIAPDKHVIYPEQFDPQVRRIRPVSRTDQLFTALADTGVAVDVRPALLEAKARERLYHVTDTHWNERGAYVAYRALIDAVRQQAPAVPPPLLRSAFDASSRIRDGMDLAAIIGLKHALREEDLRLVPSGGRAYKVVQPEGGYATGSEPIIVTEIPGSNLPRAMVFRDSFTSALAPFLSEHFRRTVYAWQHEFETTLIEREGADVVIHEIVGRHLYSFTPTPSWIPEP
jgi:hypothetical protein